MLGGFYFVHQILKKAEGACPAAGHPPYHKTDEDDEGQWIVGKSVDCRKVLQCPDGARKQGSGAGIAVQDRHAHPFQGVGIDRPRIESGHIAVGKNGACPLC